MRKDLFLAWALAAALASATPVLAVDPFYDRLYRDGLSAASSGDHGMAARKLRLACFGMLDEPAQLAGCLGRLAFSQSTVATDPGKAALRETVAQLLDLERRFQALTRTLAAWPMAEREALERLIGANSSATVLAEIPAFRMQAIRQMPFEERRRELDRRQAGDPRNPDWRQMLAELFYEAKQYADAVREAQSLIELRPQLEAGRCLRGAAQAGLGECVAALGDLALCTDPRMDPPRLRCLIKTEDAVLARSLVARLTAEQRASDEVKALERELVKLEKKQVP
jgi:tetratricopeptide (TPR) repeat protein